MGLAEQVRRKLRITYSDPDTDERVDDIMEQADADLRGLLGIDDDGFSFAQPGTEQVLVDVVTGPVGRDRRCAVPFERAP